MTTAALHKSGQGGSRQTAAHPETPSLLNGDHLSVPEFERRYEAASDGERAELIEGIVIMSPPISSDHAEAHGLLVESLRHYARATRGVTLGVNASVRLGADKKVFRALAKGLKSAEHKSFVKKLKCS